MQNLLNKRPSECNVLIVDDEVLISTMLKDLLKSRYKVRACQSGKEALSLIDTIDFDVIVTDLKLPDISGIDVLRYAKTKDEYTEVIVITGFASLDSATVAINLGVYSYLMKPLSFPVFLIQVERAIATRLFHLKSIRLMQQSDLMEPEVKGHLSDITSLYFFLRKLMLSLEVSEIMRITLKEVNQKTGARLSVICVSLLGFSELFSMPATGDFDEKLLWDLLSGVYKKGEQHIDWEKFNSRETPVYLFKGKQGEPVKSDQLYPVHVPMMVTDRAIGTLTVFFEDPSMCQQDQNLFLYVFSSIVSSIVEHGYSALQARQQAKTDSLTGIANHRLFHQTLEREIARANRKKGQFSLILIDIDNFKKVNDTYGHQVGDAVIIDLTRRISSIIRTGDVLARYGGEEFGIILPDTDLFGVESLASRVLTSVSSSPLIYSQFEINYTVSIGYVVYEGTTPVKKDQLISVADAALYDSKRNGKNRVSLGHIAV
ncbi:MAG TPA: diguanylate cyclase [Chitinispirillaceae bacterium]|nr:diguanylate cyclase [Chitinispirillaceae bacterium]